jgi:inhibitor of KinA
VGADPAPRIAPLGDSALLVVFGEVVEPELSQRARALARAVEGERARGTSGWGAPVAAYASVLVPFDPLAWPLQVATTRLAELVERMDALKPADDDVAEPIVIDVRYGGEDGPDLEEVARRTGLAPAEVIGIHCGALYRVYFLGFAPGFGYLGPLPERLRLPRRDSPRVRVPAGSVAIAGAQTAIYPLETPGGWHLIGRTDAFMWEADRDPPALLQAGRSVRFRAVGGLIGGVVTRR